MGSAFWKTFAELGGGVGMRVAVTGGAGFIGSNLVDALLERGDDVLVIDNLVSGKREYLNPAVSLATVDITVDSEGLESALRGRDVVFHTAALTRIQRTIDDPINSHATNVTGTLRVLKAARDAGVRRVVYSSSSSVYGDQPVLPLTEDMVPNPLNPYACQKYMGELYARDFHRTFGLQTVCLRYFNVYGPRQVMEGAYRLVIGIFMDQMRNGEPLTIHGDGEQTRDFTWVGDVVRANMLAAESDRVGAGEPINVGAGQEVSINHIADLFGGPVVHTPPRGFDERFKRASVERAREVLGWAPTVNVDEGIRRLLASPPAPPTPPQPPPPPTPPHSPQPPPPPTPRIPRIPRIPPTPPRRPYSHPSLPPRPTPQRPNRARPSRGPRRIGPAGTSQLDVQLDEATVTPTVTGRPRSVS